MKVRTFLVFFSIAAIVAIGFGAWHILPRSFPEFTIKYSPFTELVIKSAVYGDARRDFLTVIASDSGKWNPIILGRMRHSSDRKVRAFLAEIANQKVAQKLIEENDELHEVLVAGLADSEEMVRYYAAAALGNLKYSAARQRIEALTMDESPDVRGSAVWALGEIADQLSVPALMSCLGDRSDDVRGAAIDALIPIFQKIASEDGKGEVIRRIDVLKNDASTYINGKARAALRTFSEPNNK